ncbi:hypothetical protein DH2020_041985 [Rehmannia glutinosa]|uniref:DOG1 domain-containing protein n=1 Tax=Rehmannia glutinosa TaxID=99300 RepID=A0ABR0UPN9_REHGL
MNQDANILHVGTHICSPVDTLTSILHHQPTGERVPLGHGVEALDGFSARGVADEESRRCWRREPSRDERGAAQSTILSSLRHCGEEKIEALRVKIKSEEERVEREMERQQVAMADRKMVELARLESVARKKGDSAAVSQVNGLVEAVVKGLLGGLEKVMKMADCVRLKTLKGVLDVLTPLQRVDFLAATSMLQIQLRKWGKRGINVVVMIIFMI